MKKYCKTCQHLFDSGTFKSAHGFNDKKQEKEWPDRRYQCMKIIYRINRELMGQDFWCCFYEQKKK